ncbi:MAG: 4'-phosphopantetheinyl transferase superfamily protein [Cohnella sp.]|nr:4'-phosphopantetheinyl transferase superfamily protein [Cohnella sp.]
MNVRVFAVRMPETGEAKQESPAAQIERWKQRVPDERRARIVRYRHWEDQWRSLAGDMIVRRVLRDSYGVTDERLPIGRNAFGKPEIEGGIVQFNVSHSGAWTVAAFHGESSVGIDIERIGPADMAVAKSMFARREYEALRDAPDELRDDLFYRIWSGKESYIKAVGGGLSIPLDSFIALPDGSSEQTCLLKPDGSVNRDWTLRGYAFDPEYALTVCAAEPCFSEKVDKLDARSL